MTYQRLNMKRVVPALLTIFLLSAVLGAVFGYTTKVEDMKANAEKYLAKVEIPEPAATQDVQLAQVVYAEGKMFLHVEGTTMEVEVVPGVDEELVESVETVVYPQNVMEQALQEYLNK